MPRRSSHGIPSITSLWILAQTPCNTTPVLNSSSAPRMRRHHGNISTFILLATMVAKCVLYDNVFAQVSVAMLQEKGMEMGHGVPVLDISLIFGVKSCCVSWGSEPGLSSFRYSTAVLPHTSTTAMLPSCKSPCHEASPPTCMSLFTFVLMKRCGFPTAPASRHDKLHVLMACLYTTVKDVWEVKEWRVL